MQSEAPRRQRPAWLRARAPAGPGCDGTHEILTRHRLATVCQQACCPNIGECWEHGTATFLLMGESCTRSCGFCAVRHGRGAPLDPFEPLRLASAVAALRLRHVVVTSVSRDDLADGGSAHFAAVARAVKRRRPECTVEMLVPDFMGKRLAVDTVADSPIDVFNHNLETVPRLYGRVRPGARYDRSLRVLAWARERRSGLVTKSGLMVGLGETLEELRGVWRALRAVGCEILTLGQYLPPSPRHLPVERYASPAEFEALGREAAALGFVHVESGPLVRSSYRAWTHQARGQNNPANICSSGKNLF